MVSTLLPGAPNYSENLLKTMNMMIEVDVLLIR